MPQGGEHSKFSESSGTLYTSCVLVIYFLNILMPSPSGLRSPRNLKKKALRFSQTPETIYQTTRCNHIPEDLNHRAPLQEPKISELIILS